MKLTQNDMLNTQISTHDIRIKMRFTNPICLNTYGKIWCRICLPLASSPTTDFLNHKLAPNQNSAKNKPQAIYFIIYWNCQRFLATSIKSSASMWLETHA